jgi:hypothetical protein
MGMVPGPIVLDLTLCDYVIVEEGTRKVSLIGIFGKLPADHFPFLASPFCVHSALTDGLGDATIDLVVSRLDTLEEVYARQRRIIFSDRLRELHVIFRISDCSFPTAGIYQVVLLVDKEWAAQRRFRVVSEED